MESGWEGGRTSPPGSCPAVAKGRPAGQAWEAPGLREAAPRQPEASLLLPPLWASLSYPRSGCPGHSVPGARPAPPCPASSSLQHLPPTAGHTLDSPSKIPPKQPGPHRKGPREEGKDSVVSALQRWDRPAWHQFLRNFLKKCVPERGLGRRLGLAPCSPWVLEPTVPSPGASVFSSANWECPSTAATGVERRSKTEHTRKSLLPKLYKYQAVFLSGLRL